MKKMIFLTAMITTLLYSCCGSSCSDKEEEDKAINSNIDSVDENKVDVSLSTPELFGGSGFGIAFMSYIKTQNFDLAISFTSTESIDKHGRNAILDKYKSLKIDYTLKQASKSVDGYYTTLRYTTNEFATSKYKDFVIVVENDSCKIVLPDNLDDFLK